MRFIWLSILGLCLSPNIFGQINNTTTLPGLVPAPGALAPGAERAPGGGAAMADFDSLIQLIQSTVEPSTWPDGGGTSRMERYAGGIILDANEMILSSNKPLSDEAKTQALDNLVSRSANPSSIPNQTRAKSNDWRADSKTRYISLRRLQAQLAARSIAGLGPDEAMKNLAGITRLYATIVTADNDDIVLVGSVGTLKKSNSHGWGSAELSRPTIRLEDLAAILSITTQRLGIRCSIDPTQQGLANVQQVASELRSGKIKGAAAEKALSDALGPQVVSLSGINIDHQAALPFMAADLHMKMLAFGVVKMPAGIDDYFQWTEKLLSEHGLPDGQLMRLWFTGKPIAITASRDGRAWGWSETPIQLLSERELADAQGNRQVAGQDPRAAGFSKQLSERFASLPRSEPVYGRLAGLFELTLGLGLAHRQFASPDQWDRVVGLLATSDDWLPSLVNPPRFVPSLVAGHSIRSGKRTHQITVISGGIELNGQQLVNSMKIENNSAGDSLLTDATSRMPASTGNWWWD